jgi:hypothetical protein
MKLMHIGIAGLLAAVLAAGTAERAHGGENCEHCQSKPGCKKVCRLVREEKKVAITCWGCLHEDFCVPGPSKPGCKHREQVCADCPADSTAVKTGPKHFVWFDWIPGRAKVYTRHKLMKKTETRTVPSYRWVIENVCDECESRCSSVTPEPNALPPPPVVDAIIKHPGTGQ